TREVIDAAATKPFGFMPFHPGPGIGGHCIPADPLYLSWKMRVSGYEARCISMAPEINRAMAPHALSPARARPDDAGPARNGGCARALRGRGGRLVWVGPRATPPGLWSRIPTSGRHAS